MMRLSAIKFTLLILISACNAQSRPLEIKEKKTSNNQYKDFTYDEKNIWGLTTKGDIFLFDINSGEQILNQPKNDSAIILLTKDKNGDIIIADKSHCIKKYNKERNSWVTIEKYSNTVLGITFDSQNNYYLITNKGIFDVNSRKCYYPDSSLNYQIRHEVGWFQEPVYMMDKNDNIWIGFGYGEWGGSLFIFNTGDKKFITPELNNFLITLNPIKSIFESQTQVYVTSGLMHFSTHGSIARFDDFKSTLVFESENHRQNYNDSSNAEMIAGEYIGPGDFNQKDNCIYFYSQNGVFKGNPNSDLSKIEYWSKVFQPKLHWSNGQPDAVGSPMNVLKLKFINESKLIFVSQNDGIGIYDGKSLIMTR